MTILKGGSAGKTKNLIDFAALSAWVLASGFMVIVSFLLFGEDFRGYYAAARVLLQGGNPYDYAQVSPILLEATGRMGNNPYYYPPWFAWLFTPIAWLPYGIARALWAFCNLILWLVGLWNLGRFLDWPPVGWRRWTLFLFATIQFAWITWRYEQAGILLLTLLVATLFALREEKWGWAGLWLALLLTKPNVTFLLVISMGAWLLVQRKWKPVLTMLLSLFALLSVTTLATPGWYRPLFQNGFDNGLVNVLDGPGKIVGIRINTTLLDWLNLLGIDGKLRIAIYLLAGAVGAIVLIWMILRSSDLVQVTVVTILVGFALTPYALQYDFPLLTLPLFWAVARLSQSGRMFWVGMVGLNAFNFGVLVWERPISDGYWIVLGLIALTLLAWFAPPQKQIEAVAQR